MQSLKTNPARQIIGDRRSACGPHVGHWGIKDLALKKVDLRGEILYTWIGVAVTLIATFLLYNDIFAELSKNLHSRKWGSFAQDSVFVVVFLILIYGNLVYQLARAGYLYRLRRHLACAPEDTEAAFLKEKTAPPVTILIPSYKEEPRGIREALFSSALQDYPARRVVLLIDDPPQPTNSADLANLVAARNLPGDLQILFDVEADKYREAHERFLARAREEKFDDQKELLALSELYGQAADWFHHQAKQHKVEDHTDELFVWLTFTQREELLRSRAQALFQGAVEFTGGSPRGELLAGYYHLASLFAVEFTSFERKQYVNLSWASNKAMNLNSYLGLIGRRWKKVVREDGTYLEEASASEAADLVAPEASYIVTLDADSLLVTDYVNLLIHFMEDPVNERVAVAQTPYTAVPSPKGLMERIAGATTDLQYIVHQGFTQAGATYWVGANAILRKEALDGIVTHVQERGFSIAKYIQDRTVIEDTESSIDLVVRGWSLYNLPERLIYSATPADFGSLLIQRRRWANGGLIILPKLLRHLICTPHRLRTWIEGLMRVNYLTSIAGTNLGLLLILMLPADDYLNIVWLPITALSYYWLYGRDLVLAGYRVPDLFRVYALNFMLIPVNLGGVFKSIQQGVTGNQIPFSRTPKVRGRTAAPAGYVLAEYALMFFCFTRGLGNMLSCRWLPAVFFGGSGLVLLYAISVFIGFRASWEDLSYPLRSRLVKNQESISFQPLARDLVHNPLSIRLKRKCRRYGRALLSGILILIIMGPSPLGATSVAKAVSVLMYHRMTTSVNSDLISLNRFTEQMQYFADHQYHTLKISESAGTGSSTLKHKYYSEHKRDCRKSIS